VNSVQNILSSGKRTIQTNSSGFEQSVLQLFIVKEEQSPVKMDKIELIPNLKRCSSQQSILNNFFLMNVIDSSLSDNRMDLWGEHEHVTDAEFVHIVLPALLTGRAQWKILDLRRSHISHASVQALCSPVYNLGRTTLVELCLGSTSLGDVGVKMLSSALIHSKLEALNLFDNRITDVGVDHLAKILHRTSLTSLNLNNNEISDDGAARLASACMIGGTRLKKLLLNMNNITDRGAKHLTLALKRSCLTHVSLRGNYQVSHSERVSLGMLGNIAQSSWYGYVVALLSPRTIVRIGTKSPLQVIPLELIRQLAGMLYAVNEEVRVYNRAFYGDDEEEEEEDIIGFQEDYFAAMAHHKRRCPQLANACWG